MRKHEANTPLAEVNQHSGRAAIPIIPFR